MVKNATVLIVEDDVLLAECYERWLVAGGFTVRAVNDAQQALDELDDHTPDVILLDMLLHGANGMQLLNTLQSHADLARVPVVVCSNALPKQLPDLTQYGVKVVLDKTVLTRQKLIAAVGESLL